MKRKNASLNEAAFKMLTEGSTTNYTTPGEHPTKITESGLTKITKGEPTPNPTQKGPHHFPVPSQPFELTDLEKEQMELIRTMSMAEEQERKKVEDEEQRILEEVIALSMKESEEQNAKQELMKKEKDFEERERLLRVQEEALKRKEEDIKIEKKKLEQQHKQQKKSDKKIEFLSEPNEPEIMNVDMAKKDILPVAAIGIVGQSKPKKKKKVIKAQNEEMEVKREMDLPPVMQQRHGDGKTMNADFDFIKEASSDLFKKERMEHDFDSYADFDPTNDPFKQDKKEELSMRQLMAQKMK